VDRGWAAQRRSGCDRIERRATGAGFHGRTQNGRVDRSTATAVHPSTRPPVHL
jgi:hypothetical protein